jgi:hypothetical protein
LLLNNLDRAEKQLKPKEIMQKSKTIYFPRSGIDPPAFHPRLPAPEGAADGGQVERRESNNRRNPVNPV